MVNGEGMSEWGGEKGRVGLETKTIGGMKGDAFPLSFFRKVCGVKKKRNKNVVTRCACISSFFFQWKK